MEKNCLKWGVKKKWGNWFNLERLMVLHQLFYFVCSAVKCYMYSTSIPFLQDKTLINKCKRKFVCKGFQWMESKEKWKHSLRSVLRKRCSRKKMQRKLDSQNPRKVLVSKFTAKVTGDAAFLKTNSFTSIFEYVWPQFQLAPFMKTYCSEQLYNSSDCQ